MSTFPAPKAMLAAAALGGALVGGTDPVFAQADHPRDKAPDSRAVSPVSGFTKFCAIGFETATKSVIPPDDGTGDNPPANSIALKKDCDGPVVATFSAEVSTFDRGSFIHLDIAATCTASPAGGCTPGTIAFAEPGHTFLRNSHGAVQVHAMTMVFPSLPRGTYRFRARVGGDGTASVDFRTFTVMAFAE